MKWTSPSRGSMHITSIADRESDPTYRICKVMGVWKGEPSWIYDLSRGSPPAWIGRPSNKLQVLKKRAEKDLEKQR